MVYYSNMHKYIISTAQLTLRIYIKCWSNDVT